MGNTCFKKTPKEYIPYRLRLDDLFQGDNRDLCVRFETDQKNGLSNDRAKKLLKQNGPNYIKIPRDAGPRIVAMIENCFVKTAVVIRDGEIKTISAKELVVGDLVEVKAGEQVPADLRIVSSDGCKVDKSETCHPDSDEAKGPQPLQPERTNPDVIRTQNLAFMSNIIVEVYVPGLVQGGLIKANIRRPLQEAPEASSYWSGETA